MITRRELLTSPEYWMVKIQNDLFNKVEEYMNENGLTRTLLAEQLGVTKGYVSQVLNGDFNGRLSKLVELALAIGTVPLVDFHDQEDYIEMDACGKYKIGHNEPFMVKLTVNAEEETVIKKKDSKRFKISNLIDKPVEVSFEEVSF